MSRSPRSAGPASLACALLLAGCASAVDEPSCAADLDCPAGARCVAGACVANAAPVPALAVSSDRLETGVLHSFDASGSHDPDDDVASYAWAVRAVDAPCAPPVLAGAGAVASARFGCPGRFAVDVTVADQLGATATASAELEVVEYGGTPFVAAGPDLALEHACSSPPARCAPVGDVVLEALAPGFPPASLAFEWTVEPPADRPLDAGRRVTFTPSRFVASPAVLIETDGQAISGEWTFVVVVSDPAGVIGTASTRVVVGNRPPVVERTLVSPEHSFDGRRFTASGEIPFTITDPDGDALVGPFVEWRHAGDGEGSTFSGEVLADPARVTFSIEVPYGRPEDALHLIGGDGLERAVELSVSDVNGATTAQAWPIVVGNRPPRLVAAPALPVHREHWYDRVTRTYRAELPLASWSDPDGDPMFPVAGVSAGDAPCSTLSLPFDPGAPTAARVATVSCAVPFTGTPAASSIAGTRTVTQAIQDPWTEAKERSTVAIQVGNRAPTIAPAGDHVVTGACTYTGCCRTLENRHCLAYGFDVAEVVSVVPSRWEDPDGDPIEVIVGGAYGIVPAQPLVCAPGDCALALALAAGEVCGSVPTALPTVVSDGGATATSSLTVVRRCTRP
jgi:hypothetical protein